MVASLRTVVGPCHGIQNLADWLKSAERRTRAGQRRKALTYLLVAFEYDHDRCRPELKGRDYGRSILPGEGGADQLTIDALFAFDKLCKLLQGPSRPDYTCTRPAQAFTYVLAREHVIRGEKDCAAGQRFWIKHSRLCQIGSVDSDDLDQAEANHLG